MTMGVENINFLFSLSYYVSETGETGMTGDGDVRVIVKDHADNVVGKFIDDVWINYTVGEWLDAAGVNLDEPNLSVTNEDGANLTNPFWRVTGVNVVVDVQFYNLPTFHGALEWMWHKVAVIHVRNEEGWAGTGSHVMWHQYPDYYLLRTNGTGEYYNTDSYEYGVKFLFLGSGFIGKTDRQAIQDYFISSIVLLSVIPTIVAYLGMKLFGFNSEIYSEQLRQHPDGIIRDMELYLDTFNFLFENYRVESKRSKMCCSCVWAVWGYFVADLFEDSDGTSSSESVTATQFAEFCTDREIANEQMFKMWSEINNDPYLATKKFFTSKTLWKAVRSNYDKVSQRIEIETTLIRRMWKKWDEECLAQKIGESMLDQRRIKTEHVNLEVVELMKNMSETYTIPGRRKRVRL